MALSIYLRYTRTIDTRAMVSHYPRTRNSRSWGHRTRSFNRYETRQQVDTINVGVSQNYTTFNCIQIESVATVRTFPPT